MNSRSLGSLRSCRIYIINSRNWIKTLGPFVEFSLWILILSGYIPGFLNQVNKTTCQASLGILLNC